ncbi:MAG: hypothetical protein WBO55_10425 [Rhizobiaceae bacterium]
MFAGLKQYFPVLGMVLATLLGSFYVALGDNIVDSSEMFIIAVSLCGAITVYVVPRFEQYPWLKPAVAAVSAALVAAGAAFATDGISAQEWMFIATQVLAALGVVVTTKSVPSTEVTARSVA